MHQRPRNLHTLYHTTRKADNFFVGAISQLEPLEQLPRSHLAFLLANTEILRVKQKNFASGQAAIEIVDLRHDADASLYRHRIARYLDAVNSRRAFGRQNTRGEHADGRGFPCPIRSQQAKEFAAGDFKRYTVQGFYFEPFARLGAVGFSQILDLDNSFH